MEFLQGYQGGRQDVLCLHVETNRKSYVRSMLKVTDTACSLVHYFYISYQQSRGLSLVGQQSIFGNKRFQRASSSMMIQNTVERMLHWIHMILGYL